MGAYKEKHIEPVEQLTVEEDLLVINISSQLFDVVGNIENVDLSEEGSEVEAGEVVATIIGDEDELELRSPISGIVLEINDLFSATITQAKKNSNHLEWLVKIEPHDPEDLLKFEE